MPVTASQAECTVPNLLPSVNTMNGSLHPSSAGLQSLVSFPFVICISINGMGIRYGRGKLLKAGTEKRKHSSFSLIFSTSSFFPGGMQALFKVRDCRKSLRDHNESTKIREYFIAAEEIIWNYGPSAVNHFTGQELTADR